MTDPYAVFGVPRGVDEETLKRRWRELARRHHPDRGGDPAVFAELSAAWAILSDPAWRARVDAHGADATSAFFDPSRVERPRPPARPVEPGADLEVTLALAPGEARSGGVHEVTVEPARTCDTCGGTGWRRAGRACGRCEGGTIPGIGPFRVQVPAGVVHGQVLVVPGFGRAGRGKGASPGDLRVVVDIPPVYTAVPEGTRVQMPVHTDILSAGGAVRVPTPDGRAIRLTIPAGARVGQTLRVPSRGIAGTDLHVELAPGPDGPRIVQAVRITLS